MDYSVKDLAWMSGAWRGTVEPWGGVWEEIWSSPDGGSMLGVAKHYDPETDTLKFTEFGIITNWDDGLAIRTWLSPQKGIKEPHSFRLISTESNEAVFEHPTSDFPKRLTYKRVDENHLHATLDGQRDGEELIVQFWLERANF